MNQDRIIQDDTESQNLRGLKTQFRNKKSNE